MSVHEKELKELEKFILDIDCLNELDPWVGKFNIFDILRNSRSEIRHSNILSWLLNPNGNHGMRDAYLYGIIKCLIEKNDLNNRHDKNGLNLMDLMLMDLYDFILYRELDHIDILLVSTKAKVLFAIENKTLSNEHSNQLKRYKNLLQQNYNDYQQYYIFLTPNGTKPSDEDWDTLTYNDVANVLENVSNKIKLQSDVKLLVENYIHIVRRDIVEDQKLIEICNKINSKYKDALELIFRYRTDGNDVLKNTLSELAHKGKIIYNSEYKFNHFSTKEINNLFPPLENSKSNWNTNYVACYWIEISDDKIIGHFEFEGRNAPESSFKLMQKIIDCYLPNDKNRDNFVYKRVFKKRVSRKDNDDNELLQDNIKKIVDNLIDEQNEMLKKIGVI